MRVNVQIFGRGAEADVALIKPADIDRIMDGDLDAEAITAIVSGLARGDAASIDTHPIKNELSRGALGDERPLRAEGERAIGSRGHHPKIEPAAEPDASSRDWVDARRDGVLPADAISTPKDEA